MTNLKKLINQFVECGESIVRLEKEYDYKVSSELTLRYAKVFKDLVAESVARIKIN